MVLVTPEEMKVLVIIGKLLLLGCILTIVWHFVLLLVEGFNFAGMCAQNPNGNVSWRFGNRFRPILWAAAIVAIRFVFF